MTFQFVLTAAGLAACDPCRPGSTKLASPSTSLSATPPEVLVKLIDFGHSQRIRRSMPGQDPKYNLPVTAKDKGTLAYNAPERFAVNPSYDHASDAWSMGCVIFFLLLGIDPFTHYSIDVQQKQRGTTSCVAVCMRTFPA